VHHWALSDHLYQASLCPGCLHLELSDRRSQVYLASQAHHWEASDHPWYQVYLYLECPYLVLSDRPFPVSQAHH
jgi:hypothetical protein